jgi:putative alpha-1,2-mannosidase
MLKMYLGLLVLWSSLYSLATADRSWNSTSSYAPKSTQGYNITNPFQYVDPLVGTAGGMEDAGHVFPGATLPYGMVKAVADTNSRDNHGGFATDNSQIIGFSHMHDSGVNSLEFFKRKKDG